MAWPRSKQNDNTDLSSELLAAVGTENNHGEDREECLRVSGYG